MSTSPGDASAFVVAGAVALGALLGVFAMRLAATRRAEARPPRAAEPKPVDDSFEQLLRALPVAALVVDQGGYVTFVNRSAAELFRLDEERTPGRAIIEAIPSLDLERLVRRALQRENASGIVSLRRLDGEVTVAVTALPGGEEGGALVVGEDRTKLLAMERVRRDFIADVSHELRTPISAIKLMVETIQLSNADPEAIDMFFPKIATELTRITNLVEDLLALARNESGQVRLQRSQVDLRRLIDDALGTFRPRAQSLAIALEFLPGEPVQAEVDPERITQVVVNLVDNALRHTPPGGRIAVSVEGRGDEVVLTVADDGVGIPFKDLPHVFERFYVVERSRARESSGTGLGLAIVKQILEAHGGTIEAESDLGSGATFICRLPAAQP